MTPKARGFTLLELLLVLLIIATMMAVVAPALRRLGQRSRLDAAAVLLVSLLNEARTRAITQGTPCQAVVDPSTRRCWLAARGAGGFARPAAAHGRVHALDPRLAFAWSGPVRPSGDFTIQFEPDGRVQVGRITVSEGSGRSIAVTCRSPAEPYRIDAGPRGPVAASGGAHVAF